MTEDPTDDLLTLGEGMAPELPKEALPEDLVEMLPKGVDPQESAPLDLTDPDLKGLIEEYKALSEGLPPLPAGPRSPKWDRIEAAVLDPTSNSSISEVAEAHNIKENSAYRVSKLRNWMERKRVIYMIATKTNALSIGEAAQVAAQVPLTMASQEDQELRMLAMVDRAMVVWDKCLDAGRIQFKSAKDLDIMVRLVAFIQGRAERIIEQRHRLSPKEFEKIVSRVQKRHRWSPKLAGVVQDAEFTVVEDDVTASPTAATPPGASPSEAPSTQPGSESALPRQGEPTHPVASGAEEGPPSSEHPSSPEQATPDGNGQPGTSLGRDLVRAGTLRLRPRHAPAPTPPTPATPATAVPAE